MKTITILFQKIVSAHQTLQPQDAQEPDASDIL